MRIKKLMLTGALVLACATPVWAQEHAQPGGAPHPNMATMYCTGGMGGMMHMGHSTRGARPMQGMMSVPSPAMLLKHKGELGLNATQVSQLETLQKQAEPGCMQHMQLGMTAHRAADAMLESANPDMAAYAAKMKEAAGHMVEGNVAMVKAGLAAREVLTPAQREKCEELMKKSGHHKK